MRVEDIAKALDTENEDLSLQESIIFILDKKTQKTKRIYISADGEEWEEVDVEQTIEVIVNYLKEHVDVKALLTDYLQNIVHPAMLLDILERVKNQAKVVSKPRECYSLTVGGKPGHPLTLCLVHNVGEDT